MASIRILQVKVGNIMTRRNILQMKIRSRRSFASSSSSSSKKTTVPNITTQKMLARTLYKQILKWSRTTGSQVPFDTIPPLTLMPPNVDKYGLETMATFTKVKKDDDDEEEERDPSSSITKEEKHLLMLMKDLPSNSIVEPKRLIIPIENATCVRNATRMAYALNRYGYEAEDHNDHDDTCTRTSSIDERYAGDIKARVSLGFEVLKSLNQLSEMLEERKKSREEHRDRSGVRFHVGQVVRHKTDRWRAIIGGWNKQEVSDTKEPSDRTSLTNKEYTIENESLLIDLGLEEDGAKNEEIEYTVHVDEGDAALARMRVFGSMKVKQYELEPVTDDALMRLRNSHLKHYFDTFNARTKEFVPGKVLRYEYPGEEQMLKDCAADNIVEDTKYMMARHENAKLVLSAVKEMARRLHRVVLDITSCAKQRNMKFLADLDERLEKIEQGNLSSMGELLSSEAHSSHKMAIQHLHALLNVALDVNTSLYSRRIAERNKGQINFPLGSVVKHKKYGFRGVVVAWDPYPKTDVSRWDGLQHIEGDVNNMPFYHLLADIDDTVRAFGQERPFRYVCQDNLEPCPDDEKDINVSLDDGWEVTESSVYKAPDDLLFCHAEGASEDMDIILNCLQTIQRDFDQMCIQIRNNDRAAENSKDRKNEAKNNVEYIDLCLHDLFELLHNTECIEDAFVAEEGIKELWKAHEASDIRWSLDEGTAHLLRGDKMRAMEIYNKIVEEDDPKYVEAWNKKATCHYMLGEMPLSVDAAIRACTINKDHFQAHAGLGLVYNDTNQYTKAVASFRKCLSLNPWSPVASRLNTCIDTLRRLELEEEIEEMNKNETHD